ncbi:MAG: hypothetical protein WC627_07200 [Legionella sp.]
MAIKSDNKKVLFHTKADILVHYYPGKGFSPTQATRYISAGDTLKLPNGEHASTNKPGQPLFEGRHFYFPNLEEIGLHPGSSIFGQIINWFYSLPSIFKHWWYGIKIQRGDKAINDASTFARFTVDTNKASCGQATDIAEFARSTKAITQAPELANKARVYFGVSRGAAATFSAIAENKTLNDIALCILEAPPASIRSIFKSHGKTFFHSVAFGKWVYKHFHRVLLGNQHQPEKIHHARGHIDRFPVNVPLFIISSKNDRVVPHENTLRLALRVANKRNQALKNGVKDVAPVYFLQLEETGHNEYATKGNQDSLRYRNTLHAICRKHNLPHIPEYATQGLEDMFASSLLDSSYEDLLKIQDKFWQTKDAILRHQFREEAADLLKNLKTPHKKQIESIMHYAPLFAKPITSKPEATDQSDFTLNYP